MILLCHTNFEEPDYYFNLTGAPTILIPYLQYRAPTFIKRAKEQGILIYGCQGQKTTKQRWISTTTKGTDSPETTCIKFSNGVKTINYSSFDDKADVTLADMQLIVEELQKFTKGDFTTGNSLLGQRIPRPIEIQRTYISPIEEEHYWMLVGAMRGGATWSKIGTFPIEIHPDVHQMYSYIFSHNYFPMGDPVYVKGYFHHQHALYAIADGTKVRVRKDGFPLIPDRRAEGMLGADGEWFDSGKIGVLCTPDFETLQENYEFDGPIRVVFTLYWPKCFSGATWFAPLIKDIYNMRKKFKGQPQERLYKKLNEILPGRFEMTVCGGGFWKKNFTPNKESGSTKTYNPKIGIFITAYARQYLSRLLHMFPHEKIIGYDTDSIHFAGTPEELPQGILDLFGNEPGQLHMDGYYKDVTHEAAKRYYGTDAVTGQSFRKMAGESKDGKAWHWNKDIQEFELVEIKYEKR